jgi:hypothetical protein
MNNDTITFEKVSIAEARAAYEGTEGFEKDDPKWTEKRRTMIASEFVLQDETRQWLDAIPIRVRPRQLSRQFPRIVNNLFSIWRRPDACLKAFDDLMIDHRGTRKGFPLEVAKEITDLKVYYMTEVYQMKPDTWVLTA